MTKCIVIADADAIIAQIDANDLLHQKALEIVKRLVTLKAHVLYPSSAILEAATHVQRALGNKNDAFEIMKFTSESGVEVIEVDKNTIIDSMKYFEFVKSKKNTPFDCTVAALAKKHNVDAIFSFDEFYKKLGFKLASEL